MAIDFLSLLNFISVFLIVFEGLRVGGNIGIRTFKKTDATVTQYEESSEKLAGNRFRHLACIEFTYTQASNQPSSTKMRLQKICRTEEELRQISELYSDRYRSGSIHDLWYSPVFHSIVILYLPKVDWYARLKLVAGIALWVLVHLKTQDSYLLVFGFPLLVGFLLRLVVEYMTFQNDTLTVRYAKSDLKETNYVETKGIDNSYFVKCREVLTEMGFLHLGEKLYSAFDQTSNRQRLVNFASPDRLTVAEISQIRYVHRLFGIIPSPLSQNDIKGVYFTTYFEDGTNLSSTQNKKINPADPNNTPNTIILKFDENVPVEEVYKKFQEKLKELISERALKPIRVERLNEVLSLEQKELEKQKEHFRNMNLAA